MKLLISHKCKFYLSTSFSEVALNTISKETGKLSLYKTVEVVYRYEMYLDIKTVDTEKQSQSWEFQTITSS